MDHECRHDEGAHHGAEQIEELGNRDWAARGRRKALAGFSCFGRDWREHVSLREPSSSDRKNAAPLEPFRCAAVLQARGIAPINK